MLDVAATRYFTLVEEAEADTQKITPLSSRIRGFLRGRQTQTEGFLEKIVNINSWVRNIEGINKIGNYIIREFKALGFSGTVFPQLEIGNNILLKNTSEEQFDILFLSNLDITEKVSNHEHFRMTEQKIFGSGVWENKGGIAILLSALRALKFTRRLHKKRVAILLTTDNSLKGKFSRELIQKLTEKSAYVIGLKGAFRDGGLVSSRSGSGNYRCYMKLKNTEDARDVALAQSKFLQFIRKCVDMTDYEKGFIVAVTKNKMESSLNEPYAHSEVQLSLRFQDYDDVVSFDQKIKTLVSKKDREIFSLYLEKGESRPAMSRTPEREEFWKKIKKLSKKLDIRLLDEHRWSSSDICFADKKKTVIDGMGPVGAKPKNAPEYILRHSLLERALLLAMTINELK
jgi:D-alanine-D-alanine ligase